MLYSILRSEIYFIPFFEVAWHEIAQVRKLQEFDGSICSSMYFICIACI